jgi:hypothetical protein
MSDEKIPYNPVAIWYMRNDRTSLQLPLNVERALELLRIEREKGHSHGMLCSQHPELRGSIIQARGVECWQEFEALADEWLARAVMLGAQAEAQLNSTAHLELLDQLAMHSGIDADFALRIWGGDQRALATDAEALDGFLATWAMLEYRKARVRLQVRSAQ